MLVISVQYGSMKAQVMLMNFSWEFAPLFTHIFLSALMFV